MKKQGKFSHVQEKSFTPIWREHNGTFRKKYVAANRRAPMEKAIIKFVKSFGLTITQDSAIEAKYRHASKRDESMF